jgi:peptidoglycan hydrolase-like protein with peptidoglycan-binding domain
VPGALLNPPTATGTVKVLQTLTATSGQWLGAPTSPIPADGPTHGTNAYPVKSIQTYLTRAGIPTTVDGAYGPGTTANVKTFQTKYGLLSDGLVGPVTWSKMLALKLYTGYTYQWVSCTAPLAVATASVPATCSNITTATSAAYVLKSSDLAKHIAVKVTGVRGATSESRWSVSLGPVIP